MISKAYKSRGYTIFTVLSTILLTAIMIMAVLPFVHMLAVSLSNESSASSGLVGLLPIGMNIKAYMQALTEDIYGSTFLVSIQRTVMGTVINLVLTVITAYALHFNSRHFPLRKLYAVLFLISMIVDAGIVPGYLLIHQLGLMDTIWALALPGALPIFNVLLVMNFFRQLPIEIHESAIIDGAGHFTILGHIFIPLSKAAIATVTLFCIVDHWNAWFDGLLFISDVKRQPLQTYLQALINRTSKTVSLDDARRMSEVSQRSLMYARLIIALLPVVMVYPYLQKHFQKGIVLGSVKG